jgi:erythromycin esterase
MDEDETKVKELLTQAESLITHLTDNKNIFVSASSAAEFKQILKYVQIMRQWILINITDSSSLPKNSVRSRFKAENLLYLMEEMPGVKFVSWEHNDHIGIGYPLTAARNFGSVLREKLGNAYYAMGFEFNRGSYQSRLSMPDKSVRNLIKDTAPEAPEKSYLGIYLVRKWAISSLIYVPLNIILLLNNG